MREVRAGGREGGKGGREGEREGEREGRIRPSGPPTHRPASPPTRLSLCPFIDQALRELRRFGERFDDVDGTHATDFSPNGYALGCDEAKPRTEGRREGLAGA